MPPFRVENTRKIPCEISPTKGTFCVRIRTPVGNLLFVIEPGEKPSAKSVETFYYSPAKTHLTGSLRLACLLYDAKAMAIIEGPKKMSDDRQEWWRQQGEGYPWTKGRFAEKALNPDRNRFMRMSSLVGAITADQGICTVGATDELFFLAGFVDSQ